MMYVSLEDAQLLHRIHTLAGVVLLVHINSSGKPIAWTPIGKLERPSKIE